MYIRNGNFVEVTIFYCSLSTNIFLIPLIKSLI